MNTFFSWIGLSLLLAGCASAPARLPETPGTGMYDNDPSTAMKVQDPGAGNGEDQERARAMAFYNACDGGVALSCHNLSVSFSHRRGVIKEEARAAASEA